jgi:hypothetical protein
MPKVLGASDQVASRPFCHFNSHFVSGGPHLLPLADCFIRLVHRRRAVAYGIDTENGTTPPLLIAAGAGTGKTKTLAHRVRD